MLVLRMHILHLWTVDFVSHKLVIKIILNFFVNFNLYLVNTVKGLKIRPDPLPNMNDKRRDFCSRYDGYGDFCISELHV